MPRDRDPGDFCPTEVGALPMGPTWHPSYLPAQPQALPTCSESIARRELAAARAILGAQTERRERRAPETVSPPWRSMPELYRRMVVRAAGLGAEIVGRSDRELSEREKAMLRSAMSDMRDWLQAMVAF